MHIPVLLNEVIKYLELRHGDVIVDCTFGLGGHGKKIVEKVGSNGLVIGFDKDEKTYNQAVNSFKKYSNIKLFNESYEKIKVVLKKCDIFQVDGILFDLGVSSMQLDEESRGFSFRYDAPLDMRFSMKQKLTAQDVINNYTEKKLRTIISEYGEERYSMRIARAICENRLKQRIDTTKQLAEIIIKKVPFNRKNRIHPATRTFQAIRIEVNNELEVIKSSIYEALGILKKGRRIEVITFHSLEDRIIKQIFKEESRGCICPKNILKCVCGHEPTLRVVTKSPIRPSETEQDKNSRARSAKLRIAEKI